MNWNKKFNWKLKTKKYKDEEYLRKDLKDRKEFIMNEISFLDKIKVNEENSYGLTRLRDNGYDYVTAEQALDLINTYQPRVIVPNRTLVQRGPDQDTYTITTANNIVYHGTINGMEGTIDWVPMEYQAGPTIADQPGPLTRTIPGVNVGIGPRIEQQRMAEQQAQAIAYFRDGPAVGWTTNDDTMNDDDIHRGGDEEDD